MAQSSQAQQTPPPKRSREEKQRARRREERAARAIREHVSRKKGVSGDEKSVTRAASLGLTHHSERRLIWLRDSWQLISSSSKALSKRL